MSIETWKIKHYPVEACDCPEDKALPHSHLKWTGLRPEVLDEHGLYKRDGNYCVFEKGTDKKFSIDGDTCALCESYNDWGDCPDCPLPVADCDKAYRAWLIKGDPEPMIKLLERAIEKSHA